MGMRGTRLVFEGRGARAIGVALALLLACINGARAQDPDPYKSEPSTVDRSIATLDAYLQRLERPARMHYGIWMAVLSALAAGQGVMAIFEDEPSERTALWGGFALSTAGIVVLASLPSPGRHAAERLRRMPSLTIEEKAKKVAYGERVLAYEARAVRMARNWVTHLVGLAVSTGIFLGLGLGYDDNWLRATASGVGALVIIEARFWTRMPYAYRYLRRYRLNPLGPADLSLGPSIDSRGGGLLVRARF